MERLSDEENEMLLAVIAGHPVEFSLIKKFVSLGLISRNDIGDWAPTDKGSRYLADLEEREWAGMERSPEVQTKLDSVQKALFGMSGTTAAMARVCISCGKPVKREDFKDSTSRKEYGISRLCQSCQDKTFAEEEE